MKAGNGTGPQRKIKASEIVRDLDEGLSHSQLMTKHGLSLKELASVLRQLEQTGRIRNGRATIDSRTVKVFHILHRISREVLCQGSGSSLREVLEDAVAKQISLAGANLAGKDLSGAKMAGCDLRGADLASTDLSSSDLSRADLREANLTKAILEGANLTGADLFDAHLPGARLTGARLHRANLTRADLTGALLEEADLSYAAVHGGDFTAVRRSQANLAGIFTPLKDRTVEKQVERERRISNFFESPLGMSAMQIGFLAAAVIGTLLFGGIPVLGRIWGWLLVLGQAYLLFATLFTYQGVTGSGRGQGMLILLIPLQFLLLSCLFFSAM